MTVLNCIWLLEVCQEMYSCQSDEACYRWKTVSTIYMSTRYIQLAIKILTQAASLSRSHMLDAVCLVLRQLSRSFLHDTVSSRYVVIQVLSKCYAVIQVPPKPAETGIDPAGSASTVLLRDMHCALLRMIQNQGAEKDKKEGSKAQPMTAKLFTPDSSGAVPWTANVAQLILAAPLAKATASAKVRFQFSACRPTA